MLINLSSILKASNLSDQEISNQLGISIAKIELIKKNQLYPNQNLTKKIIQLTNSKVNLPESQFTTELKFGQPIKLNRVIFSILFIIFISLLFTGFGYQPFWIFLFILLMGLFLTLPSCFNNYWLINNYGIKAIEFDSSGFIKLAQLLHLISVNPRKITYQEIDHIDIVYQKRTRISPFDINPDTLQLICTLKSGHSLSTNLNASLEKHLILLVTELTAQGIDIYDKQNILVALDKKENLFQKFNPNFS